MYSSKGPETGASASFLKTSSSDFCFSARSFNVGAAGRSFIAGATTCSFTSVSAGCSLTSDSAGCFSFTAVVSAANEMPDTSKQARTKKIPGFIILFIAFKSHHFPWTYSHRHPWLLRYTTATDGGSVDFTSLHGCNLLGQCRSYCREAKNLLILLWT